MVGLRKRYALADTAQQIVGGFLLAGPFVMTEEVWVLAGRMTPWHALVTVGIVFAICYGALYKADDGRDPDREAEVGGITVRFVSLVVVAYGSVPSSRWRSPRRGRSSAGAPSRPGRRRSRR
jgi:uncharacterized membrane protein